MPSEIDLFGWDTAFAISYAQANAAIVAAKSTPPTFDYTDSDTGVRVQGTWGDWQITTGGDGQNLQMSCPITSGKATGGGADSVDLSGSQLQIQVRLDKVPDPARAFTDPTGSGGTANKLVVQTAGTDTNPAVAIIASQFPHASGLLQAALPEIFQTYFIANIAQFNHVFSVLMLNETADKGDYQWLKPTDMSYAVADASDGSMDKSVMAVLAMTEGKPIGAAAHQIDPRILVDLVAGANSAFAISGEKVLEHIFLPGAMAVIQGSTRDDFNITNDNLYVVNAKDLTWGNFQLDDGHTVAPKIKAGNFRMGLQEETVLLEITGATFNWPSWHGPGDIEVSMNMTQYFEFGLKQNPDGTYAFVPKTGSTNVQNITVSVTTSKAVDIFSICVGIGTAVVLAVGGAILSKVISTASTVAVRSATEGAIEITEQTIQEAEQQAGREAMQEVEQEGAQAASQSIENADNPSFLQKFTSAIAANKWKILGGVMVAIVSGIAGSVAEIIKLVAEGDTTKVPPFDGFAANCVGATKWPDTSGWALKDAGLRGPLVISGELQPSKAAGATKG